MKTKSWIIYLLMLVSVTTSTAANIFEYDGVKYMKSTDYGSNAVAVVANAYSGDVSIPNWVTDESDNSVYEVVAVYQYAFYSCPDLTSVSLGDSILYIDPNAFAYSTRLTAVTLPSKLQSLGNNAFAQCTGLLSVSIPNTVISIGSSVFAGCTSLTDIHVGSLNPLYASLDGILYNKMIENVLNCPAGKSGAIVLPNSVKRISYEAFFGCSNLTTVTIPSGVELIPTRSFMNCTSLSSISLGDGVTTIDSYAFKNCSTLMFINLPNSVYSIGGNAFENCVNMDNIDFGTSLTAIGERAFLNCTNLNSFALPTRVCQIGLEAFKGCSDLMYVNLSDSLKRLGGQVFEACSKLSILHVASLNNYFSTQNGVLYTKDFNDLVCCPAGKVGSVVLPETVKTLYYKSFYNCIGLTSVTLPASLDPIGFGGYVFYGCTGLTSIHARRAVPVDLFASQQTFGLVSKSNCTLYVPIGSLDAYNAADQWKDFFNKVEENTALNALKNEEIEFTASKGILVVTNGTILKPIRLRTLDGKLIYSTMATSCTTTIPALKPGVYLLSVDKKTAKVLMP